MAPSLLLATGWYPDAASRHPIGGSIHAGARQPGAVWSICGRAGTKVKCQSLEPELHTRRRFPAEAGTFGVAGRRVTSGAGLTRQAIALNQINGFDGRAGQAAHDGSVAPENVLKPEEPPRVLEQLVDREAARDQLLPGTDVDDQLQRLAVRLDAGAQRIRRRAVGRQPGGALALEQQPVELLHQVGA